MKTKSEECHGVLEVPLNPAPTEAGILKTLILARDTLLAISKGAKTVPFGLLLDLDAAIAIAKATGK